MRRIYESDALVRDEDPHTPRDEEDGSGGRTINWGAASHALMPVRLRDWAVSVDVTTDREVYAPGETVGVRVRFRNRLPAPVRLRTASPVRWQWAVDGVVAASEFRPERPPDRPSTISFARAERKTFVRRWNQSIRRSRREWTPVDPGEHTLTAWINVPDAADRGLRAETTIRIE
ncbi:MAG: hypothetical protein ABEJ08_03125 [Halobacteriaceae archaeon]